MISLHSIMAATGLAQKLPFTFAVITLIFMALGFTVGFLKGFRRVSWDGLTWATAGVVFLLISHFINPEGSVTKRFVFAMLIALVCIAGVLAVYGILAYYLRPKVRWVKDNVNADTTLAEYGLEFEPEYLDYDGEDDWQPYGKRIHKTGFGTPSFFFRMMGGIACAINVGMIFWTIASVVVLLVNSTGLANRNIGLILQDVSVQQFLHLAQKTFFDMVAIGIVILVAKKGYVNGWLNTIRMFLVWSGSTFMLLGCMYLPFSPLADGSSFIANFVNRCIALMEGRVPFLHRAVGKLLAGGCFFGIGSAVMFGLNLLLKKCCRMVSKSAPTRMVDMVLSCGLYILLGAMLCVGIWTVLAAFDYVDLLNVGKVINYEGAHLSNGMYNFACRIVEKLISKI